METIENKTSIQIDAKAEVVYNLITTPKNWVGLHPVTKAVYGPDIDKEAGVNAVWIEHIQNSNDYHHSVDAAWYVTEANPAKRWQIKSAFFGGQKTVVTITYIFEEAANKTTFTRIMSTQVPNDMNNAEKKGLADPTKHQEYLERIKQKVEMGK